MAVAAAIDFNRFDSAENAPVFVFRASMSVVVGLLLGAVLDTAARHTQGADADKDFRVRSRARAAMFFSLQTLLNIGVLLGILRFYPRFTEFFQLSVCGALFGIVLFSVQRNLAENALAVTRT